MMNINRWRQIWKRRIWISVLRRWHPIVEVRVGGRKMVVDLKDYVLGRILYLDGQYEADVHGLMHCMDLQGSVCLDIGANIGLHTIVMSHYVGSSGKVFAFEPEAHNFQLLQRNLKMNEADNVTALKSAVGSHESTCRLSLNSSNFGDHRISKDASANGNFQEVPITTIDVCLRESPDSAVKFIKIDVQGFEYEVMQGMTATLKRNPDAFIFVEVFPLALRAAGASATALMQFFREQKMVGWELHEDRIIPVSEPWVYELIREKEVNVIFSRNGDSLRNLLNTYYGYQISPAHARSDGNN
jgi:FkbM family methyltransferase